MPPDKGNREIVLLGLLAILIFSFSLFIPQSKKDPEIFVNEPSVKSNNPSQAEYNLNVLYVSINPVEDGQDLLQKYFGWQYPGETTKEAQETGVKANIEAMKRLSDNKINYKVAKRLDITTFPKRTKGFQYTFDSYKICTDNSTLGPCETEKYNFDHIDWAVSNNICEIAEENNIDEIWMSSPPFIATWENFMIGPKSENLFNVNGGTYTVPKCKKNYIVMSSGNSSASFGHIYGHRVENTMGYITGFWDSKDRENYWERFARISFYSKPMNLDLDLSSVSFCGNSHFPSNATAHHDYMNKDFAESTCGDWKNIPDFTGAKITVNCEAWGCNDSDRPGGWAEYWMGSIPRQEGEMTMSSRIGTSFIMKKDWWYYLLYPENVTRLVAEMVTAQVPSSSCTTGLAITNSKPSCIYLKGRVVGTSGTFESPLKISRFPATVEFVLTGSDADGCNDLVVNDPKLGSGVGFDTTSGSIIGAVKSFNRLDNGSCESDIVTYTYTDAKSYEVLGVVADTDIGYSYCPLKIEYPPTAFCNGVSLIASGDSAVGKKGKYSLVLSYSASTPIQEARFEIRKGLGLPTTVFCKKDYPDENCVFDSIAGTITYRNYFIDISGEYSVRGFIKDVPGTWISQ